MNAPLVRDIICVAAGVYRVTPAEILGPRRFARLVWPRHVAMWAAREISGQSYPQIGRRFGGRDHTTVLHAKRKVDRLRRTSNAIPAEIDDLLVAIRAFQETGELPATPAPEPGAAPDASAPGSEPSAPSDNHGRFLAALSQETSKEASNG